MFDDLREELKAARVHHARKQRCLYCDILSQELHEGTRVIARTASFVVYAPYGSRRPYETWIVASTHGHRFELTSPSELTDLSKLLRNMTRSLHNLRPEQPIEMVIHTAPNGTMRLRDDDWRSLAEDYHWHVELAPVAGVLAGIGGFHVNTVPPETGARHLRATF